MTTDPAISTTLAASRDGRVGARDKPNQSVEVFLLLSFEDGECRSCRGGQSVQGRRQIQNVKAGTAFEGVLYNALPLWHIYLASENAHAASAESSN